MMQLTFYGWKIRAISVVQNDSFLAAALIEKCHPPPEQPRRYAFSGLGRFACQYEAEMQALTWAKLWIERREYGDYSCV